MMEERDENIIRQQAEKLGITDLGICAFDPVLAVLPSRKRSLIPEKAAAVIVCVFPYYFEDKTPRNISRYAAVEDYHLVAGQRLSLLCEQLRERFPQQEFISFCDASPMDEVECAVRAGLGVRGDHTLLIHKEFGSYLFLGTVITTLPLQAAPLPEKTECEHCGLCRRACFSGALGGERFDCERCLSHITQKKGILTEEEMQNIRRLGSIWGCDLCQEACPHNLGLRLPDPWIFGEIIPYVDHSNVKELYRQRAFGFHGLSVLQRNLDLFQ